MKWTSEEDAIIRQFYGTCSRNELLTRLPGRTYSALHRRIRSLGLVSADKHARAWSEAEDKILALHYSNTPKTPIDELMKMLPNRSLSAIYARAHILRIKRGKAYEHKDPQSLTQKEVAEKATQRITAKAKPVKFRRYEKAILLEIGSSVSVVELKMLLPTRTIAEIKRMCLELGIVPLQIEVGG